MFMAWAATLALLFFSIEQVVRLHSDSIQRAVERELTSLYEFAGSQSAAFAGTSFVGYSVGRYYGFSTAFTQISPDPERAALLLQASYGRGGASPADLPPALLAYDTVHERFHPTFVGMLETSPFDDLFLVDRLGRVVYSLRKDQAFGADLRDPRYRDLALARTVRAVMARIQQEQDPARVVVASEPQPTEDGQAVMLARPIVRHGAVEGVAVFRLPARLIEQRLNALERPGLKLDLLDGSGAPVSPGAAPADADRTIRATVAWADTGWSYLVHVEEGMLAGGLRTGAWLALLAGLAALAWGAAHRPVPIPAPAPAPATPVPHPAAPPERLVAPPDTSPPAPTAATVAAGPEKVEPPEDAEPADDPEPRDPAEPVEESGGPPDDRSFDSDEGYRRALVDTMALSLDCWQKAKGTGKIELAEESGLWRVYMDRSSLQTRTLDKYLLVETLPRNPRWRDVVRTAEYVLRHCAQPMPEREALAASLNRLKQQLRQAERV